MDNNLQVKPEQQDSKSGAKKFWKNVGYIVLAIALAFLTIFVLNLNIS